MLTNFKNINIGELIQHLMDERDISIERASNFIKVSDEDIQQMLESKSIDSDHILSWSKLLRYDLFRIYTQHLILYAPQDINKINRETETQLPIFKKNIYTKELIMYLIGLIQSGKKDYKQIQKEYNIPSTTVLRWVNKYGYDK